VTALGADPAQAITALADFQGLPHRCETVATHAGVTWVDDSKATNPGAAQRALEGSSSPLIWIAGVGAGILVVCISGFFAARGAVNAAPVDVLRGTPA